MSGACLSYAKPRMGSDILGLMILTSNAQVMKLGDLSNDNIVNVTDVTLLVDIILNGYVPFSVPTTQVTMDIGGTFKKNYNFADYDREKQFIDSILSVGKYAISHSSDYREAYHPHYRIVERRIFENELMPLIEKGQTLRTIVPIHKDDIQEHSPNVFLIMYDAEVDKEPLLKAIKEYKCEIVYDYGIITGMALKKPEDKTLEETMQYFKKVKGVTNVEYDHIIHLTDPVNPRLEIK